MAKFGRNMKLTVAAARREQLHQVMTEALGCKSMSPADDFSVYLFDDAFNVGVYWVPAQEALDDAAQPLAPWLEVIVDDVAAKHEALTKLDVTVVPYPRDPEHTYYRLPGGPVFRLATAASAERR